MQPTDEEKRIQQAVWAAMRTRSLFQQLVASMDKLYLEYPELEGMLHARSYGSVIAQSQDGFLAGLQMLMRRLPSPVADMELPLLDERTGVPVQSMGGKFNSGIQMVPTGVPDGPTVGTIAGIDDYHVALIVPCQTEGCTGRVEGIAFVGSPGHVDAKATCPICHAVYKLGYQFGRSDIQVTPLMQGDTPR